MNRISHEKSKFENSGVEECSDYGPCSVTCGVGFRYCDNVCINGIFGEAGCPIDRAKTTQSCNIQDCQEEIEINGKMLKIGIIDF